jgi:hypothetical protein
MKTQINIDERLSSWLVELLRFRNLQAETGALLFGEATLRLFLREELRSDHRPITVYVQGWDAA